MTLFKRLPLLKTQYARERLSFALDEILEDITSKPAENPAEASVETTPTKKTETEPQKKDQPAIKTPPEIQPAFPETLIEGFKKHVVQLVSDSETVLTRESVAKVVAYVTDMLYENLAWRFFVGISGRHSESLQHTRRSLVAPSVRTSRFSMYGEDPSTLASTIENLKPLIESRLRKYTGRKVSILDVFIESAVSVLVDSIGWSLSLQMQYELTEKSAQSKNEEEDDEATAVRNDTEFDADMIEATSAMLEHQQFINNMLDDMIRDNKVASTFTEFGRDKSEGVIHLQNKKSK